MKKLLFLFVFGIMIFLAGCSKEDSFTSLKENLEQMGYTFEVVKIKDVKWNILNIEEANIQIKEIYYTNEGVTYFFVCEDLEQASKLYNYCLGRTNATNYGTFVKDNIVYVTYPGGQDILQDIALFYK